MRPKIVWAMCGSFCTLAENIDVMSKLCDRYEVIPVMSEMTARCDTRFGRASELRAKVESICMRPLILTLDEAEPIGPKMKPDLAVIAPVTGNTLAKIAHGITDGVVTMAAKSTLRNGKPLLLSLASNDALGANLENIGRLAVRRGVCFCPMKQDDTVNKPYSLVANITRLEDAIEAALEGVQIRPMFI